MGIWDRLGNVINSYMNDFSNDTAGRLKTNTRYRDPDLDAAYEELDDFLNNKERKNDAPRGAAGGEKVPPLELREDFECLGVPFGADAETCKSAYKKLLKIHHPDRHAGHEGNYKKATEKSARINAAWDRIERWRNS